MTIQTLHAVEKTPLKIDILDAIESAIDYHGARYSAWAMYRVLNGTDGYLPRPQSKLQQVFINTLEQHFQQTYRATLAREEITLDERFEPYRFAVISNPGTLAPTITAGTPLIIETPQRSDFDSLWIKFQAFSTPFSVKIKTALANEKTKAKTALVWAVTDSGEIDVFEKTEPDTTLISRIRRKLADLCTRVETGNPPDPSDDDVDNAWISEQDERIATGQTLSKLRVEPDSPEYHAIQNYIHLQARESELKSSANAAEKERKSAGAPVMDLLRNHDELIMPSGPSITAKIGRRKPAFQNGSQWVQLTINQPVAAAAE